MSLEWLSTLASIGTFLVIGATAIAAVIQLRHLRDSNQFSSMLAVIERQEHPDFIRDVDFVVNELQRKLADAAYRKSLEHVPSKRQEHPEMRVSDWYEWSGTMVKRRLLPEGAFFDIAAPQVVRAWENLEQAIAVMRRTRGPKTYENFEFLAVRARQWLARNTDSYPKDTPHIPITDQYLAVDSSVGNTSADQGRPSDG
ncbi:MAG: hypothetical protein M3Z41_05155 [Candidatus Eremiobacteraeota bacterium]|nr:hypothetical protein [Candidatus Eremiobacteraeota bacterium]